MFNFVLLRAAGYKWPRTVDFGTPYKRPMFSSGLMELLGARQREGGFATSDDDNVNLEELWNCWEQYIKRIERSVAIQSILC
ncbi:jg16950 [Pararge aegeria aegeria]|uniref:Jg16950 protein n=1 Tax=Pararge aegeria aegeria TaxID=348720 RepID=A0A8S4SBI2_9NEOP|nr:jg16950 [Pararge aegeria aegeria]